MWFVKSDVIIIIFLCQVYMYVAVIKQRYYRNAIVSCLKRLVVIEGSSSSRVMLAVKLLRFLTVGYQPFIHLIGLDYHSCFGSELGTIRPRKKIFVFQVNFSHFFRSVGRKKKFFHEKSFSMKKVYAARLSGRPSH